MSACGGAGAVQTDRGGRGVTVDLRTKWRGRQSSLSLRATGPQRRTKADWP